LGVKRMRRGKDDGLHTGVLEGFHFAAVVPEALGFVKFLPCWVRLRGANDLYVILCLLQHGGHLLAPPAEANHRDFDGSAVIHLEISTWAAPPCGRLRGGDGRAAFTVGHSSPDPVPLPPRKARASVDRLCFLRCRGVRHPTLRGR